MLTKDALIRGARTALWTFIAVFGVSLLGFINDVAGWAGASDKAFPSVNPLGKAAIAALCAAASGFIGLVVNAVEDSRGANGVLGAKAKPDVEPAQGGGYPAGDEGTEAPEEVPGMGSNYQFTPGYGAGGAGGSWGTITTTTGAPGLTEEDVTRLLDVQRRKTVDQVAARVKRLLQQ